MKNNHIIAVTCFVLAGLCYYVAEVQSVAAGAVVVGMCFELAAWKNLLKPGSNR